MKKEQAQRIIDAIVASGFDPDALSLSSYFDSNGCEHEDSWGVCIKASTTVEMNCSVFGFQILGEIAEFIVQPRFDGRSEFDKNYNLE